MNWHHGIPNSCLVFLLLLSFSTSSEPSKGCIFGSVPIDTSDFPSIVKNLKKLLLLDYPVPVPVNLKQDEFCKELWHVHLIHRNLNRMINVSGSELEKSIRKLMIHTTFVEMCDINDSCVKFITTNISEFLEPIPSYLSDLRKKMEEFEAHDVPANFSNCTVIHCQPALQVTASKQTPDRNSQHDTRGKSYWVLLVIAVLMLVVFVIWMLLHKRPWQRSQRYEERELELVELQT
ncbi:fms-related tyrosine kinase 3 ligand isoform X2 [Anolis carolinensis]|uniref:fms-related tyrosine kinase 3 ligand isoform X2 n=1 Tax=Anolis carolinensis TaxID=28377 RepID=UPI002F2B35B7